MAMVTQMVVMIIELASTVENQGKFRFSDLYFVITNVSYLQPYEG
jgi:hypothetical protein